MVSMLFPTLTLLPGCPVGVPFSTASLLLCFLFTVWTREDPARLKGVLVGKTHCVSFFWKEEGSGHSLGSGQKAELPTDDSTSSGSIAGELDLEPWGCAFSPHRDTRMVLAGPLKHLTALPL